MEKKNLFIFPKKICLEGEAAVIPRQPAVPALIASLLVSPGSHNWWLDNQQYDAREGAAEHRRAAPTGHVR